MADFEDIYDGVFSDAPILASCARLHAHNPHGATGLLLIEHKTLRCHVVQALGPQQGLVRGFETDPGLLAHALGQVPPGDHGAVHSNLDRFERNPANRSRNTRDGTAPLAAAQRTEFVSFAQGAEATGVLLAVYPGESEAEWRAATRPLLADAGVHLARVMSLRARRIVDDDALLASLIEGIDQPAALLDDDTTVVRTNMRARTYFARFLRDFETAATRHVRELRTRGGVADWSLAASFCFRDGEDSFVMARVTPLTIDEGAIFDAQRAVLGIGRASAVVSLRIAARAPGEIPPDVFRAFAITAAEQRVLRGLLDGKSLPDIASANGVSYNTVRNQLASVTEKTGLHGQAALMRFFASLKA